MTEVNQLMDYYVSVDDRDHMDIIGFYDHIFDALCSYYETINEGPNDGVSAAVWLSVEMGEIIFTGENEEQEPLLYHEFPEAD
jgi:hypothetical protein